MKANVTECFEWKCEQCGFNNLLEVVEELGPSYEDICGDCSAVYSLDYLRGKEQGK